MPAPARKRLLYTILGVVAMAIVLIVAAGIVVEATFRPRPEPEVDVPAGLGHLRGRLTRHEGRLPFMLPGIAGADVALTPGDHAVTTDDDGRFVIADIEPGVYRLTAAADGFETGVIERVAVNADAVTTLPDEALFPAPGGAPVARLEIGAAAPFAEPPASHAYRTSVLLDASGSENVSRDGIRFEIRDADGALLMDPWAKGEPLQPARSNVPGQSPLRFLFTPPRPGNYAVKLVLSNGAARGVESIAEVRVEAANVPPDAVPLVIAGPNSPQKAPAAGARASSGLDVVRVGVDVYLMGLGFDRNHAAPELYNAGGTQPDIYGKNHDHLQRQFDFRWQLFHVDPDSGSRTERDDLLRDPAGASSRAGQVVRFAADEPGRYEALLEVGDNDASGSLVSEQSVVSVLAVDDAASHDGSACVDCHGDQVDTYRRTVHVGVGVGCDSCHGPAAAHLAVATDDTDYEAAKRATQDVSHASGVCGQCHAEYAEWEKSRHADGMPFGFYEIARPLLVQCIKCHYARTFAATLEAADASGSAFHDVRFEKRILGIGPMMPDMSRAPAMGETAISCTACHDPHRAVADAGEPAKRVGLRTAEAGALCQTCHEEKWQNAVLEGTAGEVGNGFEYPGEDYGFRNPHSTASKCVRCHLGDQTAALDARGVRAVGGHTLRMRDAGANGDVGGWGPRADDPGRERDSSDADDVLHLAPCRACHAEVDSFDVNGAQRKVYARWSELGDLLRSANDGVLPDYRPGDKCATCHRGGTMPFDRDPRLVLENAYTNYKLVKNDRSWGVHNPRYVGKLLADSIASVSAYLAAHPFEGE